jgi:peptide/nickel transport system permease protein
MAESYLRYLARRVALSVGEVILSVTLLFGLTTLMAYRKLHGRVAFARYCLSHSCPTSDPPPPPEMRAQIIDLHNLDTPLVERFLIHWVDLATFDWGYSTVFQAPVASVLQGRISTTAEYVLPGIAVAGVLGIVLGLIAALAKNSNWDWSIRLLAYTVIAIPSFVVATYLYVNNLTGPARLAQGLNKAQIASLALAISLLGNQIRHSRGAVLGEHQKSFVRFLRAKGASPVRIGRHILRNATATLAAATLGELLTIVMLNIYVLEYVLDIEGIALASLQAVESGDVSLAISSTLVLVLGGVAGNLIQDLVLGYVDPRSHSS